VRFLMKSCVFTKTRHSNLASFCRQRRFQKMARDICNGFAMTYLKVKTDQWFLTRGRCYDHHFLRFLPIFGEKIGVFLKNQCYDQNFAYFSFVLRQKRQIFRWIFWRKYLINHNIGPWSQSYDFWIFQLKRQ
jgi:hypothetical protein